MLIQAYTNPRSFGGFVIPISVQSCYLRDYARKFGWKYTLPVTEVCVPNSFTGFVGLVKSCDKSRCVVLMTSVFALEGLCIGGDTYLKRCNKEIVIVSALENTSMSLQETIQWLLHVKSIRKLQSSAQDVSELASRLNDSY